MLQFSRLSTKLLISGFSNWQAIPRRKWSVNLQRTYAKPSFAESTKQNPKTEQSIELERVRNLGIIAHIDAGKTTTTERMLFYSGFTARIGNVDEGDTVMDYLPAERDRGITITSAAITFDWNKHRLNLIDTPGHADFTFEVIRAIRVLDGAVTVLDGVEGVEAQTEKVWNQASEVGIPRIVFVNKMDREGAGFGRTVREIVGKLQARTCIINMPLWKTVVEQSMTSEKLCGIIDVVEMKAIEYIPDTNGVQFIVSELKDDNLSEATKARTALVETLADLDDEMVEKFLEADGDHMGISSCDIKAALRRCTLSNSAVPVLCGASFRNIGVQPLLDAVVDYLPSPLDRPEATLSSMESLSKKPADQLTVQEANIGCALAFKVIHDTRTGKVLVFVRVYSGVLDSFSKLYNTTNQVEERATKLSRMYADKSVDIKSIPAGHIGVISGTSKIRTGDTLIWSSSKGGIQAKLKRHQLLPITIPSPVFFASVEPKTASDAKPLEIGLETLLREDPSLKVSVDDETGQIHLSGMGELHLEIACGKLINDLRVNAHISKIQIAYRESIDLKCPAIAPSTYEYSKMIKGLTQTVLATVVIQPTPEDLDQLELTDSAFASQLASAQKLSENNYLTVDSTVSLEHPIIPLHDISSAIPIAVEAGLFRGKKYNLQLHYISLTLQELEISPDLDSLTPIFPAIRFAVSQAIDSIPDKFCTLLEPIMDVVIIVSEEDVGSVMADLSSARAGKVYALDDELSVPSSSSSLDPNTIYAPPDTTIHLSTHNLRKNLSKKLIRAKVPLGEMVGYLKYLRAMTQGRGSFLMSFDRYERVSKDRAEHIWENLYS
ncbi:P-loop containing nucleoside triphosphate hydrolase protein [Lipomyces oligophaga]|uniref:P-loop containing nucleoside triphosphate hydrolase protein n=1 Tax=Lipomyces oligophaga TaxID=45792 RepID=UPI0034CD7DD6